MPSYNIVIIPLMKLMASIPEIASDFRTAVEWFDPIRNFDQSWFWLECKLFELLKSNSA